MSVVQLPMRCVGPHLLVLTTPNTRLDLIWPRLQISYKQKLAMDKSKHLLPLLMLIDALISRYNRLPHRYQIWSAANFWSYQICSSDQIKSGCMLAFCILIKYYYNTINILKLLADKTFNVLIISLLSTLIKKHYQFDWLRYLVIIENRVNRVHYIPALPMTTKSSVTLLSSSAFSLW